MTRFFPSATRAAAAAVLAAAVALGGDAVAQTSPAAAATTAEASARPPIDDFFRLPQFGSVAVNPGSSHVAFLREIKGRNQLLVMDLATQQIVNVASYDNADVIDLNWIGPQRLLYRVADPKSGVGNSDKYAVVAVDRDGGRRQTLNDGGLVSFAGTVGSGGSRGLPARATFFKRVSSGNPDDFIAQVWVGRTAGVQYVRIDSRSGARTAVDTGGLGQIVGGAFDANDTLRAALTRRETTTALHVRDAADSPWRKVVEYDQITSPRAIEPLRFDALGNFYVAMRGDGQDHLAIHRFDWKAGAPEREPLFSVKGYDLDGGLLFDADGKVIGVRYEAETVGTHWLDPAWKAHQAAVDAALAGKVNTLSGRVDGAIVVRSWSDTSSARYYLFDPKASRLRLLGASRPWLEERRQAQSDVIRYAARDGLSIPALLTLPRGVEARKLPLVVLVHGGPFVRGVSWGWSPERQFLASRGYAVLEPDYRGSTGHGWRHFRAGWKQWGLAMQDDLADGVADLVKRGIVDDKRVCIAGASYGGYAVVMGLVRHPEMYRCGISWVGVTDIELLYTVGWGDTADSEWARYGMPTLVGDRTADRDQLRATSAIHQAARIKAPLLLGYGREDVRVPYDHGERLRDALRGVNPDVQYVEYAGEAHGWYLLETNRDFWSRAESLLMRTIGAGVR